MLLILALTCGMGYVALFGIGEKRIGSAYNVKQGLDLAGGVSITYEIVGDEAPTKEVLAAIALSIISTTMSSLTS